MKLRIGIDLGGTKTEGIVMDTTGAILFRERRPTPAAQGYEAILDNIHAIVRHLEARAGGARCPVGVGTPGATSAVTGTLKNSNTTCLIGKPIRDDLEKLLARPVRIANDANCFALSEALDGAGMNEPVVFGVILGTGVGGGIVVNGQLLEGLQHIAGEWGHNVLEPDGPPCYCGKRGCVETFLSGPGLARDYISHGGKSNLDAKAIVTAAAAGDAAAESASATSLSRGPRLDPIAEAASATSLSRGPRLDPIAEAAMQRYLDRFGRALAAVINILDPHAVVLGGGMSNIARLYTEGREHVAKYVFNDELRTKILPNVHGDSSGVRGAAQLWPADSPF